MRINTLHKGDDDDDYDDNNNNNKGHTRRDREGPERRLLYRSTRSLISALDGVGGQRHAPAALSLGKRPHTRCTGAWVVTRAGLDGYGKYRFHPPGVDHRTVRTADIRYTDWAIPAHNNNNNNNNLLVP